MASTDTGYWYASATEKQRKETIFWKEELKTYLSISKEGVPVDTLNELLDNDGVGQIPYKKLGFRHLNHFVYECSSFIMIGKYWNGQLFLFAKQTEVSAEVAHIAQLVKGQERAKGSNKNPRPLRHQITQWLNIRDILYHSKRNDSARDYQPPPKHFPRKRRGGRGGRGSGSFNKYPAYSVPPRFARLNYRHDSNSDENVNDEMDRWDFGGSLNLPKRNEDENDWVPMQSSSRQFNSATTSSKLGNPFTQSSTSSSSTYTSSSKPQITSSYKPPVQAPAKTNISGSSGQRVNLIQNGNIGKIYFPEKKVLTSVQENNIVQSSAVKKPEQTLLPSLIPSLQNTLSKLVIQPSSSTTSVLPSPKIPVTKPDDLPVQDTVNTPSSENNCTFINAVNATVPVQFPRPPIKTASAVTNVPRIPGVPPLRQISELSLVKISNPVTSFPRIPRFSTRQLTELSPVKISTPIISVPRIPGLPSTRQLADLSPLKISTSVPTTRVLPVPPRRIYTPRGISCFNPPPSARDTIPGQPPSPRRLLDLSININVVKDNRSVQFPFATSKDTNGGGRENNADNNSAHQPIAQEQLTDLTVNVIKDSRTVSFPYSTSKDTGCDVQENLENKFDDNNSDLNFQSKQNTELGAINVSRIVQVPRAVRSNPVAVNDYNRIIRILNDNCPTNATTSDKVNLSETERQRNSRDKVERILRDPFPVEHNENMKGNKQAIFNRRLIDYGSIRRNVSRTRSPSETSCNSDTSSEKSNIVKVARYPEEPSVYKRSPPSTNENVRNIIQPPQSMVTISRREDSPSEMCQLKSLVKAEIPCNAVHESPIKLVSAAAYLEREDEDTAYTDQTVTCGETINVCETSVTRSSNKFVPQQSIVNPKVDDNVDGITTRMRTLTFNTNNTHAIHHAESPTYEYHPAGSVIRCRISEPTVPSHQFIVSYSHRGYELQEIEREMEWLYKENDEYWKVPGDLKSGCYSAFIPEWQKWVRCHIRPRSATAPVLKKIAVMLYDYCIVKLVSRENIRSTTKKINTFPQLSYRAILDSRDDEFVDQLPRVFGKTTSFWVENVAEDSATDNQILKLRIANKRRWELLVNEDMKEE